MLRKITLDELNSSLKKSRIKLAVSRDDAKSLGLDIRSSVRMKIERNPEQAKILADMSKARFKKMFTYVGEKNGFRTMIMN